jgi:hypothetical protein
MTLGNQSNQAGPPRNQIHFARGQVHVFVQHPQGKSPNEIINAIEKSNVLKRPFPARSKSSNPRGPGQGNQQVEPYFSLDRVLTFDPSMFEQHGDEPAHSLVFVDIPALRTELQIIKYLNELYREFPDLPTIDGVEILQVTPNWLSAGAPEADGSGGPGGIPVAPSTTVTTAAATAIKNFPFELGLNPELITRRGACTDVFILDTAPCDVDLTRAYREWVEKPIAGGRTPHAILQRLLGHGGALRDAKGNLRIEYAGHSHLLEVVDAYLPDHNYVMADHGLFIAGIINSYAPAARLHLIEVLSPYGLGTLETIVAGFLHVAKFAAHNSEAKVVVNASLFLAVSQKDEASRKLMIKKDSFWKDIPAEIYNGDFAPLLSVCAFIDKYAARIVAASGNDGTKILDQATGNQRVVHPSARYPAAYDPVLGVAALGTNNQFAPYSNEPDIPQTAGAAAFGGVKVSNSENTDPDHGVIGVYIGSYPDGTPNTRGLASWSGTSFATPVISAALAALLCESDLTTGRRGDPIKQAIDTIKAKFTSPLDEDSSS